MQASDGQDRRTLPREHAFGVFLCERSVVVSIGLKLGELNNNTGPGRVPTLISAMNFHPSMLHSTLSPWTRDSGVLDSSWILMPLIKSVCHSG
jgi:hypothetical protein